MWKVKNLRAFNVEWGIELIVPGKCAHSRVDGTGVHRFLKNPLGPELWPNSQPTPYVNLPRSPVLTVRLLIFSCANNNHNHN